MQTLATRARLGSAAAPARGRAQRHAAPAGARAPRIVLAAPRAFAPGCSPYGPYGARDAEAARRMMAEFARQMGMGGAGGFAWPGGRVWVDVNGAQMGDCGAARPEGQQGGAEGQAAPAWPLAVDMLKEDDAYVIYADVPGVTKEGLTIKLTAAAPPSQPAASLLIRGERAAAKAAADGAAAAPVVRERRGGAFERRVALPADAASTGITAKVRDGVLTLRVPRITREPQGESDIPIM
ncbi:MAG: HSP20-like chaperone [Monoraphidium minutum]|nr:MAG: HSP20-like chaperone [Monoraphidium minutum]